MIFDNTFDTLSLLGPAIIIEGATDILALPIVLIGNTFSNIHSYLLTTVLHIIKRISVQSTNYLV